MIRAARLISLLALAASLPLSKAMELDVWAPAVLYPHEGVVWTRGQTHHVVWDASNPPRQITNPKGEIYLVHNGAIDFDHALASGFDICSGRTRVTVPTDIVAGMYQIDLMGDSGDWSEVFEIK